MNGTKEMEWPKVIFGTSGLGNLYVALDNETKNSIIKECVELSPRPCVFDSAGKYGAGLALESLGQCLKQNGIKPEHVVISNKLGWFRTSLKTKEPTFEPGVWCDLKHDATQKISYHGILQCYEQGNLLLGEYSAQVVSVHDPDEYLAKANNTEEAEILFQNLMGAYEALYELKQQGKVESIGVGSKDWSVIQKITSRIKLDWVMIANSMTIHRHPAALITYMEQLAASGTAIVNSAVFNGGFLIGSDHYNYRKTDLSADKELYDWRKKFFGLCEKYQLKPAEACVAFGLSAPGVVSIALNTTSPQRVAENINMANKIIQKNFWEEMRAEGLISNNYLYI